MGTQQISRTVAFPGTFKILINCGKARILAAGLFLFAMPWPVLSQQQSAVNEEIGLEEIVVTATKRGAQSAQDLALSISAISGDTLERMGANEILDFSRSVPGLDIRDLGYGDKRYIIRGVSGPGESQVGIYWDFIPVAGTNDETDFGSRMPDLKTFDIERVEVLRGPQGTLYGASSMSGVVRIITRQADATQYDAKSEATISTTESGGENFDFKGMVNVPLIEDKLAVRAVGYYSDRSGYIDILDLNDAGLPPQEDINDLQVQGARVNARWFPTDRTTITAQFYYQDAEVGGRNTFRPEFTPVFNMPAAGTLKDSIDTRELFFDEIKIFGGDLEHRFDWGDFNYSISYFDRNVDQRVDSRSNEFFGRPPAVRTVQRVQNAEMLTQEARLNLNFHPFSILVGGFYQDRTLDNRTISILADRDTGEIRFDEAGISISQGGSAVFDRFNENFYDLLAFFGEVEYSITDKWRVLGGVRWFDTSFESQGILFIPFRPSDTPGPQTPQENDESNVIFKFHTSYDLNQDMLFYAQAAQGFRAGGVNNTPIPDTPGYESDSLWNFEIGAKTSWLNNRLIFNIAAFYIDWTDIQVEDVDESGRFGIIQNAGSASVEGVEFSLNFRPVQDLTLTFSGNYNNASLDEDEPDPNGINAGAPQGTNTVPGLAGDDIPEVPEVTFSFSGDYTGQINSWMDYFLRADVQYVGESANVFRPNDQFRIDTDEYTLVKLRGGINTRHWGVQLFIDNLFNKHAEVAGDFTVNAPRRIQTVQPRTIGLTLEARL